MIKFNYDKYNSLLEWLQANAGFFYNNDLWFMSDVASLGITVKHPNRWCLLDFTSIKSDIVKHEIKYYFLYNMVNSNITPESVLGNYKKALKQLGIEASEQKIYSVIELSVPNISLVFGSKAEQNVFLQLIHKCQAFFVDYYDSRRSFGKDIWNISNIKGANLSAVDKRFHYKLSFVEFPEYYKEPVKSFLSSLLMSKSWSYTRENHMYLKRFFGFFYKNGYEDGFLENLSRNDILSYYVWIQENYKASSQVVRKRNITYVQHFLAYLQSTENGKAPALNVDKIILPYDYNNKSTRYTNKVNDKFIPEHVISQLDSNIHKLQPPMYIPIYILLRETGWRGADIMNLRYDTCLEYVWHAPSKAYVPFLRGEITKTGNNILKVPIKEEVAQMLKNLVEDVQNKSTPENNPDKYLFNTFSGKCVGRPLSKTLFVQAVRNLIHEEKILDASGKEFHFKVHSLRHTRAVEYLDGGMPLVIIKELLGHKSIDMTLHYAKNSEAALYSKWHEVNSPTYFDCDALYRSAPVDKKVNAMPNATPMDNIKIPLGICKKSSKLSCQNQFNQCLFCNNMTITREDKELLRMEINRTMELIKDNMNQADKAQVLMNIKYLKRLEELLAQIISE